MINPSMPPTVDEFREAFPEFANVSDEQVQLYLDIGVSWVDTFWNPQDAKVASMFAAAHYLWLHDIASGGTLSASSSVSGGGTGTTPIDPEVGKIWVKQVRFRDRHVTYERVGLGQTADQGGQKQTDSGQFWESSPYGMLYLSYRRRNVAHVAVI